MSEQVKESETIQNSSDSRRLSEPIAELLREIQQTPREYWPHLLQMIRLFRQTVTMKPVAVGDRDNSTTEIKTIDPRSQHEALSKLLQSWVDDGDEQEQTETAEYLRQALEKNPVSI